MKDKRGVTLTSLTIYIIVLMITLVVLTFVSANFTSQVSEVTEKGKISNEYIRLYSFILNDIKASNNVAEYSDDFVRFDNNVKYSIKYLDALKENDRQVRQYEIYRNDILISENLLDAKFDYDEKENLFIINLKYVFGKSLIEKTQSFHVGRGYWLSVEWCVMSDE